MKHAFLIIAHNEYPVLEVLLSMLDDERNDIYLHIDKRATELFQQIKKVKMQKAGFYLGTFIKYYKISQLIHTQSIAN
jgi:hypothetical protein